MLICSLTETPLAAWLEQRWGLVARTPLGARHPFVAICPCQSRDSRPPGPPITAQASQFRHQQPISASADRSGPPLPRETAAGPSRLQSPPACWTPVGRPIPPPGLRLAALSLSLPLCKVGTGRLWATQRAAQERPPRACLSGGPCKAGHVEVCQGPRRAGWTRGPGDPSKPETSWPYLPDREVALSLCKLGAGVF